MKKCYGKSITKSLFSWYWTHINHEDNCLIASRPFRFINQTQQPETWAHHVLSPPDLPYLVRVLNFIGLLSFQSMWTSCLYRTVMYHTTQLDLYHRRSLSFYSWTFSASSACTSFITFVVSWRFPECEPTHHELTWKTMPYKVLSDVCVSHRPN